MDKINVIKIMRDHFKTLVNANTDKPDWGDWLSFLLFPFIISVAVFCFFPTVRDTTAGILITVLSVFVGLLINVIVLLFDLIKKEDKKGDKTIVLSETLSNISYTILVSIIAIIATLFTNADNEVIKKAFTLFTYFLMAHIIATLLMVLKRMYLLFKNEIDSIK